MTTTPPPPNDHSGQGDRLQSHLAAAGELLSGRHYRQAEVEILRALSTTHNDVRALNLLALVRFKLGKLDEARATYREIAALQPADANIQRNFGLVSLKMERYDDAVAALERATRLAPEDLKAWSYLGYALAKSGDSPGAALAFRRAGQDLLAAQLEPPVVPVADVSTSKVTGASGKATKMAPTVAPAASAPARQEVEVISAQPTNGASALDRLPATVAVTVEASPTNALATLAPNVDLTVEQAPSLISFALAGLGLGTAGLSLAPDAVAFLVGDDDAYVRRDAALAWAGASPWQPAFRRVRGRATEQPLGTKRRGFFRVTGAGQLLVTGPAGHWTTVTLDDDIFYVRESQVLAFDRGVSWEAGRIPGDRLRLLQFRGSGRVALQFDRLPSAVRVTSEHPVFVARGRLYGWVGRIVPHALRRGDRLFQIQCEGEGVLLLDGGHPPRHHRGVKAETPEKPA
ncbi:MAG TPA: tetratricopeptide repeat protein [Polyangia bacterium]|jgi:tetratricopeptide (TPR) repeat protein